MIAKLKSRLQYTEHGQASLELALALPLVLMFIGAILVFGYLIYTHLAVLTAANDCATAGAQAPRSYLAGMNFEALAASQGLAAREVSLSQFAVAQQVATGVSVRMDGAFTCQVGYPQSSSALGDWIAFMAGDSGVLFEDEFFRLGHSVVLPLQPYKSNWDEVAP